MINLELAFIASHTNIYDPDDPNTGHGHVFPRPDGILMKCGGSNSCPVCQAEQQFQETASKDDIDEIITLRVRGECVEKLRELLTWCGERASMGTGITINAEDNGGEKHKIYIDGDGADRISVE